MVAENHANNFSNKWNFHENKAVDLLHSSDEHLPIPIEKKLGWKKLQTFSKMIFHQGQNYQYKLHFCSNEISKSLPIPVQFLAGHIQVLRPTLAATNNQKPNHINKININITSADNIIMNITDARLENRRTKNRDLRNTGINWIICKYLHPEPDKSIYFQ